MSTVGRVAVVHYRLEERQGRAQMSMAGQVLNGRYRVERLLGSGGFADVYLATDTGPLGREVAVKLLHPHLLRQQDLLERFRREAALIAQLKHPHILGVHDYGELEGAPYLVMPYVSGGTLEAQLPQTGGLDPRRVARYLSQIAGALDHAHARRIVHRDLKPGNFLLDEGDNLLLADFGIAKILQEASQVSGGTAVIGTIAYMAPEVFQGRPGPASDIYALGCIAFQLLTGAAPYGGSTEQLMYAHSFEAPPTLASRGVVWLPESLGQVLARALAKRPEDRFASAGEFAQAFEMALGLSPTQQATLPRGLGTPTPSTHAPQTNYGPATMTPAMLPQPPVGPGTPVPTPAPGIGVYTGQSTASAPPPGAVVPAPPAAAGAYMGQRAEPAPAVWVPPQPVPKPEPRAAIAEPTSTVTGDRAGFGVRLAACLIDMAVVTLGLVFVGGISGADSNAEIQERLGVTMTLCVLFYFIGFWAVRGWTPGKYLLNLRIIRADGKNTGGGGIGLWTAIKRLLAYYLSGIVLWLGFLSIATDSKREGWHDKLAGTYVIKLRKG